MLPLARLRENGLVRRFHASAAAACLAAGLSLISALPLLAANVRYDVVYVRAPRYGDTVNTRWAEVFNPTFAEPGSDLMLLHPDGTEEVLFAAGNGAVMDPAISFDAKWVYFSYQPDVRQSALNYQRRDASRGGADIYKINVQTRQVIRLTTQVWTPPTGAAKWSPNHLSAAAPDQFYLGYGIFNTGPCPLPGGKVMFTSSRDGYLPNKSYTFPNFRLYIMDDDGSNVEPVGHLNVGSALHPTVLKDGRVMFSSFETQGQRDSRVWGLWAIWPDGRRWEPLFSAFVWADALHFQTQLTDGRLAVVEYYNLNNNGFGTLLAFDSQKSATMPPFGNANPNHASNPDVRRGIWYFDPNHPAHLQPRYKRYPFSPPGLVSLTAFTHGEDEASSRELDGSWAGKVTHPSGAPNNDVLLVWSPGPANNLNRPTTNPRYDGGIYLVKNGTPVTTSRDLVIVKNDPNYNEQQPRALVPYSAIYGVEQPAALPYLPNDGTLHSQLPAGTPFGLVGTSSFYKRDSFPGTTNGPSFNGLDVFNTSQNDANSNWFTQGADAGKYSNSDIHAARILVMEALAHRSYGPNYPLLRTHHETERLRVLGEIPLRKSGSLTDPEGNPDTSFLARIPADTPFTFQTLDRNGLVLNMAQTWHQVRPGEVRTDCGGCHAHSQVALDFNRTAAGQAGYTPVDLTKGARVLTKDAAGNLSTRQLSTPVLDVEYYRDIKPLLQRSCAPCHAKAGNPPRGLALDDTSIVDGFENTYNRLAWDSNGLYGIPSVIPSKLWRQTNTSRYVRAYQSRRSLLAWKIFGQRLDGWTNADHPTESVPGDAATLPAGADRNLADLDFTGTQMPPPGSGVQPLSEDEKMLIARWIDLGAPISPSADPAKSLWMTDDLKPTLTVASPRAGVSTQALAKIQFGAFDATSGLDRRSISVTANFAIGSNAAGAELAALFSESGDHVWTLDINPPVASLAAGLVTVKVRDVQGNESAVQRAFRIEGAQPPAALTVTPSSATLTPGQTVQFTGTLTGQPNAAISWSISPALGTITANGIYTAPVSISAATSVTVIATSVDDRSKTGSATVTLQPSGTQTPQAPAAISVAPNLSQVAANAFTNFTFTYSDPNGVADLRELEFMFQSSTVAIPSGRNSCLAQVNASSALLLADNSGQFSQLPIQLGSASAGVRENSQCAISGAASLPVSDQNGNRRFTVNLKFQPAWTGRSARIYMRARDAGGLTGSWRPMGVVAVR